ncbi:MAG: polysaccharide deacetylase family protein [Chitinophagaceae bacterium]|nr:polysaccharide deacetylase family protein [Chitinophagaceae bacterium]
MPALITIINKFSRTRRDIGWKLGLNQSYVKQARGARILIYHGVCVDDPFRFNSLFVNRRAFEDQLKLYKQYFNIVSLDDFYHQRFSKDRYNICLTFDDGFANNYRHVLPLLELYQVHASFFITAIRDAGFDILWNDCLSIAGKYGPRKFIFKGEEFKKNRYRKYVSASSGRQLGNILLSTGFEDKVEMMDLLGSFNKNADADYWLQMTVEQVKALSASKWVTIGNHSYYHNDLGKMPVSLVGEDISRSKQFLENVTGKEVKALAFPYGSYTREAAEEAKKAGFTQLLATEFLFPEDTNDATFRERLTINPFISNTNQLHANITGHYK